MRFYLITHRNYHNVELNYSVQDNEDPHNHIYRIFDFDNNSYSIPEKST